VNYVRASLCFALALLVTAVHVVWAAVGIQRVSAAAVYGIYLPLVVFSLLILAPRIKSKAFLVSTSAVTGYLATLAAYFLTEALLGDPTRLYGVGFSFESLTFFPAVFMGWAHAGILAALFVLAVDGKHAEKASNSISTITTR